MLLRVIAHDWQRIGRRHVPAGGKIRHRPLRRNPECDFDLAHIGGQADAATHYVTHIAEDVADDLFGDIFGRSKKQVVHDGVSTVPMPAPLKLSM